MLTKDLENFLKYQSYKIKYLSIISTSQAGSGHVTSALSASDLIAAIFFYAMNFDPYDHDNPNNDRFILSKGHAAPALYAVWAQLGILNEKDLLTLRQFNSILEGHPTPRFNQAEAATGSLGQGLSIGAGIALSAKLDKRKFYTYVLIGDGETAEGQIWEAAEIASYYKLNNLIAILDVNRLGQAGETMLGWDLQKYADRFAAFGWHTEIIDGHNIKEITHVLNKAKKIKSKPVIIIAKTIKGYGVKEIENKNHYHGKAIEKNKLEKVLNDLSIRFGFDKNYTPPAHPEPVEGLERPSDKSKKTLQNKSYKLPEPKFKLSQEIATRHVYGQALVELATIYPELICLDAEVKNSTFSELLQKEDAKKFIECFIAEQNMVSMAVGLFTRGKIPFISTFACFLTRAFDQLRMAVISRAALRVCGSHAGVSIGQDGPSQMGLEDIAMFNVLPNSIILYPSDAVSCYKLMELMINNNDGISYLRTTRPATQVIYKNNETFKIGGCKVIKQSNKDQVCIIAAGITLHEAIKAYTHLKKENILVSIIDLYCVKPIDKQTILKVAQKSQNKILTVEDHYLEGGIGQIIASNLINEDIKVESLAVRKIPMSGKPEELMNYENIDSKAIIKKVKTVIKK